MKSKIKIKKGKWQGDLLLIDFFINLNRVLEKKSILSSRSFRTENFKKQNYQFNYKN